PTSPATIYAGTYAGVIKSTDAGVTWHTYNNGMTHNGNFVAVASLAIDPSNTNTIYAVTVVGVYKSTNGGDAWGELNNGLGTSVTAIAIDPSSTNTLYAGVPTLCFFGCVPGGGVFKSTDSGGSWKQINTGLPFIVGISYLAVDPSNTSTIYAVE